MSKKTFVGCVAAAVTCLLPFTSVAAKGAPVHFDASMAKQAASLKAGEVDMRFWRQLQRKSQVASRSQSAVQLNNGLFLEPEVDVLLTVTGEQPGDGFGWVAEDIGDINGDGASDFITTAPFFFTNLPFPAGKFYVYSGADGVLLNSAASTGVPVLGWSAKSAGDVDGDGVGDYIVGSLSSAAVYSGATHSLLHFWFQPGEFFGSAVDRAGDLNNDGVPDLLVGARYASYNGLASGRIYAFSGADGSVLWTVDGDATGDELGTAVGFVGDIDGDTVPDLVAGARGAGNQNRGRAYAMSGHNGHRLHTLTPAGQPGLVTDGAGVTAGTFGLFHAFGVGDVDGDGLNDIYVGDYNASTGQVSGTGRGYLYSGLNGEKLRMFNAENKRDGLGPARGVGDVDGDGYADLFIAAYTYTGGSLVGKGYLHSGADFQVIRTMTGTVPGQFLGVDALGLSDVNGDGLTDYMLTGSGIIHIIAGIE